jgi:transposase
MRLGALLHEELFQCLHLAALALAKVHAVSEQLDILRSVLEAMMEFHEFSVKTFTLERTAEKWYVVLSCDLGDVAIEPSVNPPVGIDVGLKYFLSKSDGSKPEPNPLPAISRMPCPN